MASVGAFNLSACTSETADAGDYENFDDDLTQGTSQSGLWQSKTLEYCFPRPSANLQAWEARKREFIDAINATWQAVGVLNLVPRDNCAAGMLQVRYSMNTATGGQAGIGRYGRGIDMDSEFLGNRYQWGANTYHTFVAAHEFGHALGFRHEQDHPNSTCRQSQDFNGTGIALTGYDTNSIMNYCARQVTGLTELDKQGFRRAYAFLGGGDPTGGTTSTCSDNNSQCANWAAAGECSKNPNYMLINCCVSCNNAAPRVISRQSGKCMDVKARATADGTNIQLYSCNGTGAQAFILKAQADGSYNIVNTNSNKCVDVAGRGTADGTNIQLYTCNNTTAQAFTLRDMGSGFVSLVNTNSGKCVDVSGAGTADGTNIHLWTCHDGLNQQWRIGR